MKMDLRRAILFLAAVCLLVIVSVNAEPNAATFPPDESKSNAVVDPIVARSSNATTRRATKRALVVTKNSNRNNSKAASAPTVEFDVRVLRSKVAYLEPIIVTVRAINSSSKPVGFPNDYCRCIRLQDEKGTSTPPTRFGKKHVFPGLGKGPSIRVDPGEIYERTFVLNAFFDLSMPGKYTLFAFDHFSFDVDGSNQAHNGGCLAQCKIEVGYKVWQPNPKADSRLLPEYPMSKRVFRKVRDAVKKQSAVD